VGDAVFGAVQFVGEAALDAVVDATVGVEAAQFRSLDVDEPALQAGEVGGRVGAEYSSA
jgi:hypothetical protein